MDLIEWMFGKEKVEPKKKVDQEIKIEEIVTEKPKTNYRGITLKELEIRKKERRHPDSIYFSKYRRKEFGNLWVSYDKGKSGKWFQWKIKR